MQNVFNTERSLATDAFRLGLVPLIGTNGWAVCEPNRKPERITSSLRAAWKEDGHSPNRLNASYSGRQYPRTVATPLQNIMKNEWKTNYDVKMNEKQFKYKIYKL